MDTSIRRIGVSDATTTVELLNSITVTNLVCGVQDRLILDTFDTQHNTKTKSGDILGSTYTDIRMHHSTLSDFFLARLGSDGLDRAQEARCCLFVFFA
jgi:hypothetical protein